MALVKNFTQIPNEIFQSQSLSAKAMGLYAYLKFRSYSGNARRSFPSQKKIMKDLKIGTHRTLRNLIRELVVNGFLEWKKGSIYTGNSDYKLLVPNIPNIDSG